MDRMDRIGLMWIEIGPNRTKVDKMDQSGRMDEIGLKWTK